MNPLRLMGAQIEGARGGEYAPLRVVGASLMGQEHQLPIPSAQVKSALLLAGLRARGVTTVREPARSRDHTERLLRYLGVDIEESPNGLSVKSTSLEGASLTVPGDLSSAAFLLVAAAILPGSDVTVAGVGLNPTRTGILDILGSFGASVEIRDVTEVCGEPVGAVRVTAGERRSVQVSGELALRSIDELPLVALLGAAAEQGETTIRDAAELRVKESDRLATTAELLRAMGAEVEVTADGLAIGGAARLRGARVDAAGDHRIAMVGAVAALAAEGPTRIDGWEAAGVSYPGFEQVLEQLVVR